MTELTAPLHQDQVSLLRTMAHQYLLQADGTWPTWYWVVHALDGMDLDAGELIRSLPRIGSGPSSYGFTRGIRHHIADEERVSLTIAAAVHVDELNSMIAPRFLRVLPHLVALQRTPPTSGHDSRPPRVTSGDLLQAFPERPEFIRTWLPAILDGEPATWWGKASGHDHQGNWYRDLSREIRRYKGVSTLAEYIAAVTAHLAEPGHSAREARSAQPQVDMLHVPDPAGNKPDSASVGLATDDATEILLMWLAERVARSTTDYVNIAEFAERDSPVYPSAAAAAELLKGKGRINLIPTGRSTITLQLTALGLLEADRIAQARRHEGARHDHAFNELVTRAWGSPRTELDLQRFVATTYYLGELHNVDTVIDAARDLAAHELADLTPPTGRPTCLRLTAHGKACARSGKKATDYVTNQNTQGPTFNQYNYAGSTAAQGQHVTQNIGLRPDEITALVQQLRNFAPALDVDHDEFIHEVEVLESSSEDIVERRRAGERIRGWLESHSGTMDGIQTVLSTLALFLG